MDLFESRLSSEPRMDRAQRINLPNADIVYLSQLLNNSETEDLLHYFLNKVPWQQPEVTIYGRRSRIPRLVAWYGDVGATYRYSSISHDPLPWTSELLTLKRRVEAVSLAKYNSVLLNLYRNERDSIGWHSDNEPELGESPMIASLSLGDTRKFRFRSLSPDLDLKYEICLEDGSLLLMRGTTQKNWQHCIPRLSHSAGARVNLTFRFIVNSKSANG
jgi:alkylated DNA repair dioxygenase AlkB